MDSTTTTTTDPHAVAAILAAYGLFFLVFFLVAFVLQLVICWRIAVKAGYSGVLSLLMLVPLVNFIVILMFAFMEWPIEAQVRAMSGGTGAYPPGVPPGTAMIVQ